MKKNHFCNRDSLKDAMKNLGLKNSDIDMSNKRSPVDMSVSDIKETPKSFKRGGMAMVPVEKRRRSEDRCFKK